MLGGMLHPGACVSMWCRTDVRPLCARMHGELCAHVHASASSTIRGAKWELAWHAVCVMCKRGVVAAPKLATVDWLRAHTFQIGLGLLLAFGPPWL